MTAAVLALVMAFLPGLPAGGSEDLFGAAEAAFRSGSPATAEALYRRVLDMEPNHTRALVRLATLVSWSDRLQESRALFERVLRLDPGSTEARLGLARVLSWSAEFDRSVALYRDVRAENPLSREAALGIARAQGWAGRHGDARATYLEILAGDPNDTEARNGLAAVLSWDGRLDEALGMYEKSLAVDPGNGEALAGRARVMFWQGRTPEAWAAVGEALKTHPGDREVAKVDTAMREALSPAVRTSASVMHDNDKNAITTQQIALDYPVDPAATVGVSYDRLNASLPLSGGASRLESRLETLKATATLRAARDLSVSGGAGFDRITHDDSRTTMHMTAAAGADYRLDDRWWFSGSMSRETFAGTARSLDAGVGLTSATATAAFVPAARVATRLTLQRSNTTDGNQRDLAAGLVRWALPARRPRVGISWSGRYFAYDRKTGNGYFAPESFLAQVAGIDLADRIGRRFSWSAQGSLGLQRVKTFGGNGQDTDTVRGYHVAAAYDFARGITAEAYLGRTNLALEGVSGFRSVESGFRVRLRIGAGGPATGRGARPGEGAAASAAVGGAR